MKYRIFCTDCNSEHIEEALILKPTCPVNSEHSVDESSIIILTTNEDVEGMKDYKKQRQELIEYVIEKGENLTPVEFMLAAEHFCLPQEQRDLVYSVDEQVMLGRKFHTRSCAARNKRYNAAVSELFNRLSYDKTYEIIQDLNPGNLIANYINLGVEGVAEGDVSGGVFDYFLSTSGTSFEGAGFLQKNWEPLGMSLNELSARVIDILKNGNY